MLNYLVEFLGTFLFSSVFVSTGQPLLISLALFLIMMLGMSISGTHLNPAISLMSWAKGALTTTDFLAYVTAQILGGLGALVVFNILGRA